MWAKLALTSGFLTLVDFLFIRYFSDFLERKMTKSTREIYTGISGAVFSLLCILTIISTIGWIWA